MFFYPKCFLIKCSLMNNFRVLPCQNVLLSGVLSYEQCSQSSLPKMFSYPECCQGSPINGHIKCLLSEVFRDQCYQKSLLNLSFFSTQILNHSCSEWRKRSLAAKSNQITRKSITIISTNVEYSYESFYFVWLCKLFI